MQKAHQITPDQPPRPAQLRVVPADLDYYSPPTWFESEIGRRLFPTRKNAPVTRHASQPARDAYVRVPEWQPAFDLGPNLRLQVRDGYQAVIKEVDAGLHLVSAVPRTTEVGIIPLIAPALVSTLVKALGPVIDAARKKKADKEANAERSEADADVGCSCCRGRCGRGV